MTTRAQAAESALGVAQVGQRLTAKSGETSNDTTTTSYQWQRSLKESGVTAAQFEEEVRLCKAVLGKYWQPEYGLPLNVLLGRRERLARGDAGGAAQGVAAISRGVSEGARAAETLTNPALATSSVAPGTPARRPGRRRGKSGGGHRGSRGGRGAAAANRV